MPFVPLKLKETYIPLQFEQKSNMRTEEIHYHVRKQNRPRVPPTKFGNDMPALPAIFKMTPLPKIKLTNTGSEAKGHQSVYEKQMRPVIKPKRQSLKSRETQWVR
jgi:hypothetical protein